MKPEKIGTATMWLADCIDVVSEYDASTMQLLITSTPYPGQRGFNLTVDEYFGWWMARFHAWVLRLDRDTGVVVQNVMFKRTEDGWFNTRIFDLPMMFEHSFGMPCVDVVIWDKLNSPPSGNHDRHDRCEYEFCFVHARSDKYTYHPYRLPYSSKTVGKAQSGNMRQADIAGSHQGGHARLHPKGARQGNVVRASSSGDQGRPRVKGGVFPQGLAERFVLQYSDPGDTVVDICGGSGTVMLESIRNDRKAIYVDVDKDAYATAKAWLEEELAKPTQATLL